MSVLESFMTGDTSQNQLHNHWIDHIQGSLRSELGLDLEQSEAQERRSDFLYVRLCTIRPVLGDIPYSKHIGIDFEDDGGPQF
jgi:hypothetical protein